MNFISGFAVKKYVLARSNPVHLGNEESFGEKLRFSEQRRTLESWHTHQLVMRVEDDVSVRNWFANELQSPEERLGCRDF